MDMASARWLLDLGLENSQTLNPKMLNGLADEFTLQKPARKVNKASKSSSNIISFENMNMKVDYEELSDKLTLKSSAPPSRIPSRAREHVVAERKRRERLTQCFIALSSLVPGLKKLDKASVLGDAIKYIKQLQDRKKTLEEEAKKKSAEPSVYVRKSVISGEEGEPYQALPEIEARVSNLEMLVRIHCNRQHGVMATIISEVEKLDITIINTFAMPFGNTTLDITILAQVGVGFKLTVKDLAEKLQSALLIKHVM